MFSTFAQKLSNLFRGGSEKIDLADLEDLLLEADLGPELAMQLTSELKKGGRGSSLEEIKQDLHLMLDKILIQTPLAPEPGKLNIFMILGVNGVGKTTTIAKLAKYFFDNKQASKIILAAGDTFRAAAGEQLSLHGDALGVQVVSQQAGADPAAVLFDALDSAKARGADLVLADTAGRMHTREDLIRQLEKIDKILAKKAADAVYKKILVLDVNTGQNALVQAETFHKAVGIDTVILAKYDSTAKGGIAAALAKNLGLGISFLGTGENRDAIHPFQKTEFIRELLDQA
jgi:fused signal recognition particle receptor